MNDRDGAGAPSFAPRSPIVARASRGPVRDRASLGPIFTDVERLFVGPVVFDELPVPAVGLAAAGGDDLQALRASLEAAGHLRRDADHVPLLDLDDLVVELDAARAGDDGVDLLLDLVAVAACLISRLVAPSTHAELGGIEKLPREAALDAVPPGGLDVLEVLDRVVGRHATNLLVGVLRQITNSRSRRLRRWE